MKRTYKIKMKDGLQVFIPLQPDQNSELQSSETTDKSSIGGESANRLADVRTPIGVSSSMTYTMDSNLSLTGQVYQWTKDVPFICGPPVPADRFYGRFEQRDRISGWLGGQISQSFMVIGMYRSGKTSLLHYIRQRPNEFFSPSQQPLIVYLDFAEETCQTPIGVLESLRRELTIQMGTAPWQSEINGDPHAVKAALEHIRDRGYRLVVLIDEFQAIERNAETFVHWGSDWRSKVQNKCFTIVIASLRPVAEVYRQAGRDSPFGNDLRDLNLGTLEQDAWQTLVHDGFQMIGKEPTPTDLALIDDLAGGLPLYTQLAADVLTHHTDYQIAKQAFALAAMPHFTDLWWSLTEQQRHALRLVVGIHHTNQLNPAIRYLLHVRGILRQDNRPFSSAFAHFVREQS